MALRFRASPVMRPAAEDHPSTPPRFVVARRAMALAAATVPIDLMTVTLAYATAGAFHGRPEDLPTKPAIIATIPCWLIVFFAFGLYSRRQVLEPSLRLPRVLSGITTSILLTIVIDFSFRIDLARGWVATLWVVAIILVISGRLVVLRLAQLLNVINWLGLRTVVVGSNAEARTLARVLRKKRHLGYEVLGFIGRLDDKSDGPPVIGTIDGIRDLVINKDIAAIFIAGSDGGPDVLTQIDKALAGLAVRIRTSLGLPHLAASRVLVQEVDGMAMLAVERVRPSEFDLHLKRALDVALAGIGLLGSLPFMVVIGIAIKVSDGGPVIFAQKRVGAGGELFTMYKFRTMVKGAENLKQQLQTVNEADGVLFKMRKDPRITRIGRQLRRFGLDELPQLVNIFLGEMSLVGPRPALPEEMERWTPDLAIRLKAKPGLTGLWQVSGRHELAFEDYVRYDLFYVENWSFKLDLQIIARTVPAVLSRAGAY
jgi:exopolysaccharide biosynthesis polyprenyl glycosylphosphotransferase